MRGVNKTRTEVPLRRDAASIKQDEKQNPCVFYRIIDPTYRDDSWISMGRCRRRMRVGVAGKRRREDDQDEAAERKKQITLMFPRSVVGVEEMVRRSTTSERPRVDGKARRVEKTK